LCESNRSATYKAGNAFGLLGNAASHTDNLRLPNVSASEGRSWASEFAGSHVGYRGKLVDYIRTPASTCESFSVECQVLSVEDFLGYNAKGLEPTSNYLV